MLQELAVMCHSNLDLMSTRAIGILFAGVNVPSGILPKFIMAATQQLICEQSLCIISSLASLSLIPSVASFVFSLRLPALRLLSNLVKL
jgi:hypothetical protein